MPDAKFSDGAALLIVLIFGYGMYRLGFRFGTFEQFYKERRDVVWKRLGEEPIDYSSKTIDGNNVVVSLAIKDGIRQYSVGINSGYILLYHDQLKATNIDEAEREAEIVYEKWKNSALNR